MALGGVISNVLSSVRKLLPVVSESVQAPSSSSSPPVEDHQMEAELKALMRMLERIKATLYDAEGREITDISVKLWLKELKEVAYNADDILDDYNYEVLRAQVEARDASQPDSRKRKQIQMPDGMFDQIKHINDMFDEIEKHRVALRLSNDDGVRRYNSELQIAPTSHFVKESNIYGREMEKEELITMLSSNCDDRKVVYVVTIVGTGGLGKTTLAQLAYNNQRIKQRFDKFVWICVSEDFNVQRLTREAIESNTRSTCDLSNLSALQEKISEEIRGKRVIIVLDDVWNENTSHWELFQGPFTCAKEVKILVTTRNESVAIIMQTVPSFKLGYMSREQSWRLFEHYAFGDRNQNEASKLVEIGKKILEKCGKLPLAIKSIASLLRHEIEEEAWIDILESEIWNYDKLCNDIFTPLQLSYTHLPTYLKPCFLYCSLFPKDYSFRVKKLVSLWISQGYIESNGKKSAKKIGQEYAMQLWHRSFFEGQCEETWHEFKLHDMIHDLARKSSGNECYSIKAGKIPDFPERLYHLFIGANVNHLRHFPSVMFTDLRTLIIHSEILGKDLLRDFNFSDTGKLRVLKLHGDYWHDHRKFSSSCLLGDLKHVRYLSVLSWSVPESLFSLYFLISLTLNNCDIKVLPESIRNFVSLEELIIVRCWSLKALPTEIGSLTNLRTLILSACNIKELPMSIKNLTSLEELRITECESLEELPIEIGSLKIIRTLFLGKSGIEELPESIGNLVSLEELTIIVSLQELPIEIGSLKNLRTLFLGMCYNKELPKSIGNLVSLEELIIDECNQLEELPTEIGNLVSLEELIIDECNQLEELPTEIGNLTNLRTLTLRSCDVIELPVSIGNLVSLEELTIDSCSSLQEIPTEIGSLQNLRALKVCGIRVNSLPPSLNKIIGNIQTFHVGLKCQKIGWLKNFVNIKGSLFIAKLGSIVSVATAKTN